MRCLGFDARNTVPYTGDQLRTLRTKLVQAYPREQDARRVATDADLPPDHIPWGGSAVGFWHAVLEEAAKHNRIDALARILSTEYPALMGAAPDLEVLLSQRDALRANNGDTTAVDAEIVAAKRAARRGPQLQVGEYLGDNRYRLVKELGHGGFATVWLAYDRPTRTHVAMKVLHGQWAHNDERIERFDRGARALQRLRHPNVVRIERLREEEHGFHYFVMEYLPGGTLREAVLSKRLTTSSALEVVLTVGEALAHVHAAEVVHRDVKPANVLLREDGTAVLTDFDLALLGDSTGGTRTGALGTVFYMAPEAIQDARNADARSDVFSLGMTALFALLGRELTRREWADHEAALAKVSCDARIKAVLSKALAEEPDDRYPDMASFVSALRSGMSAASATQGHEDAHERLERAARELDPVRPRTSFERGHYVTAPEGAIHRRILPWFLRDLESQLLVLGGIGTGKTTELLHVQERLEREPGVHAWHIELDDYFSLMHCRSGMLVTLAGLAMLAVLERQGKTLGAALQQNAHALHGLLEHRYDPPSLAHRSFYGPHPDAPSKSAVTILEEIDPLVTAWRGEEGDSAQRHIVLLIDALDRCSYEEFLAVARDDLPLLKRLGIGVVIVGNLDWRYQLDAERRARFHDAWAQPYHDPARQDDAAFLRGVLQRRAPDLFDADALQRAVEASGGAMRDLLTIAFRSVHEARDRGEARVTLACVEGALADFRERVMLTVTPSLMEVLRKLEHGEGPPSEAEGDELQAKGAAIQRGKVWQVHPGVRGYFRAGGA